MTGYPNDRTNPAGAIPVYLSVAPNAMPIVMSIEPVTPIAGAIPVYFASGIGTPPIGNDQGISNNAIPVVLSESSKAMPVWESVTGAPLNTVLPSITPTSAGPSTTLTVSNGTWTNSPTIFYYGWERNGVIIPGANTNTYVTITGDIGTTISAIVQAQNAVAPGIAVRSSNTVLVTSAPPAFSFPGTPAGIFSMRLAGAGYSGECIRALRSSDNAQQDIGFASDGYVDMTAAATFAAGSILFVIKWYDQSGNGLDLTGPSALPILNTIDGHGWICFQNPLDQYLASATGPNLTGDQAIGMIGASMCAFSSIPISDWDGSNNGWFFWLNGAGGTSQIVGPNPGAFATYSTNGSSHVQDTTNYLGDGYRFVSKRASGVGTVYVNGTQTATGSLPNNSTTPGPFAIGSFTTFGYAFVGIISEVYVYASAISDTDRNAIEASQAIAFPDPGFGTPYSGTSGILSNPQQQPAIVCGDVLAFERTESWTVYCAVQMWLFPDVAAVIYTNVPNSTDNSYPGHEYFIDTIGRMRVRIIHNIGANNYISVIGTTNLIDGKKHMLTYTYDGSSTAAGVKIYVDGVPEVPTIESDALSNTIIGSGQNLYIGNQQATALYLAGTFSFFQVDTIAQNQTTIAQYVNGAIPPVTADTAICFLMDEGTGTTLNDTSGNGHNGTIQDASMWIQ